MNKLFNFKLHLLFALLGYSVTVSAQKLPNKQQVSLYAPADIKIDGIATEWNNKFQARNKAIEASYTVSNDNEMLYLAVQTQHKDIVDKIIRGGITFNINHTLDKKDQQQVSVTYPVLDNAGMVSVANMYTRKAYAEANADAGPVTIKDLNKVLELKSKMINVKGINTIPNQEISVYNQDGIKAVSRFGDDLTYTYELAIPIKYLQLPNNGADGFSYQIKVNGPPERTYTGGVPPPPMLISNLGTTDFWGEYTLSKK